ASRPTGEVYAEAEGRRLTEAFNSLYYSLADKRVVFLARESQPQERAATYEFPREMKRIRDTLIQFLVDVFRPNPLQPGAILRGFYFTGTRKASASLASETESARRFSSAGEATSFFNLQEYQAKMGIAAQPRSTEQTVDRWCFVSELFHRVILPDPIAKSTSFSDRRLDLYRRIAYGGLAAFAVLLSLLWIRSWFGNRDLIHQAEDAVKLTYDYQPASHGTPSLNSLRSMDAIRQQLAVLQEYDEDGPPFRLRWGLYSGERIRPTLYKLYFQRFREVFFDDFHNSVSLDLAGLPATPDAGAHPFNTVYDRLKAYRMITSCKCTPDKSFLPPVLFGIWNANRSLDPERQELALRQIEFYSDQLRHKNPYQVAEKQEIVDHSRQYLSAFQGADRIYRGMLAGANQAPRQPARVGDIAPNFRQVLTGPGEVDAAFTKAGWDYMQNALKSGNRGSIGEPCVLGGMGFASQATQGSEVTSQIKDLYLRDYIDKWKQFLVATGIEPFRNSGDAAKKLAMLADNRSPLLAAIYLTSENTNYATTPKNAAPAAPKKPSGILQVLKRKFEPAKARQAEQLAREANLKMPVPGAAAPNQPPPGDMSQIFQPVRLVVPPGSKDRLIDAPNQKYMDALNAMQRAMDKISNDRGSTPDMSLHQTAAQASDAGMDAVRQLATKFNIEGTEGVDEQVKRLLEQPFTYSMKFVITDASKITKDKAGAAGKSFCARLTPLEKKFPFNPQSDSDVSIDEFTSVFAPQNSALATLQQALAKVVVKQGRIWAPAPDADTKLTPDFLNFLNRVSSISDAFFANGGPQPAMKYSLKPVGSAGVQSLTLNIDGEHTTGNQAKQFSWPGAPAAQQVELPVKVGATITFASYEGLWGVFRMMNDGDPRAPGSRVVVLSHVRQGRGRPTIVSDASGNPVSIRLEMVDLPNGIDVFDKNFFSVRCPGRVTQ
ncbi:MAG TPA: ImcF-related family protein, partial [Bryobacteraceae bacterium]|nr:ImcF-related family protein [Bryobacteraceae bacterium]